MVVIYSMCVCGCQYVQGVGLAAIAMYVHSLLRKLTVVWSCPEIVVR